MVCMGNICRSPTADGVMRAKLAAAGLDAPVGEHGWSRRLDAWLLQPVVGSLVLVALLFLVFQAVFAWAEWPMGLIEGATTGKQEDVA